MTIKLNKAERNFLMDFYNDGEEEGIREEVKEFEAVEDDGVFLGMDSHGWNVHACIFRTPNSDQLYAFHWAHSSEEVTLGDWDDKDINKELPVFKVGTKKKTITVYTVGRKELEDTSIPTF